MPRWTAREVGLLTLSLVTMNDFEEVVAWRTDFAGWLFFLDAGEREVAWDGSAGSSPPRASADDAMDVRFWRSV